MTLKAANLDHQGNLTPTQKRGVWITVVSILAIITLFMSLFLNKVLSPRILSKQELLVNGAIVFEKPRIINDFSLLNHDGAGYSIENLKGTWTLAYFGFTHCPDICPTALSDMNRLMNALDEPFSSQTQVIMVSVDPARDTPEVLNDYINYFNKDFVGVTGDFVETMKLAQNLNVAFNKVVTDDGYSVDHTGNLILINPMGHYHGFFKPPFELARLKLTLQSIQKSSRF